MSLFEPIPFPIEELSAATLEWGRLLELLQSFAVAKATKEWLRVLSPSSDGAWISDQHAFVDEANVLLSQRMVPSLAGLFDPDLMLSKARIPGAALAAEELRLVIALIDDIASWHTTLTEAEEETRDRVPHLFASVQVLSDSPLPQLMKSPRIVINSSCALPPSLKRRSA